MTPWQLPPDVAIGLMMNLGLANGWKAIPTVQGIGLAFGGKDAMTTFMPTLFGQTPSIKDQISASLNSYKGAHNDRKPFDPL